MKYVFGDIVIIENNLIGVVVKSWIVSNKRIEHDVYVRNHCDVKRYNENEIQRYMVRHKELDESELEYQAEAINPFVDMEQFAKSFGFDNLEQLQDTLDLYRL